MPLFHLGIGKTPVALGRRGVSIWIKCEVLAEIPSRNALKIKITDDRCFNSDKFLSKVLSERERDPRAWKGLSTEQEDALRMMKLVRGSVERIVEASSVYDYEPLSPFIKPGRMPVKKIVAPRGVSEALGMNAPDRPTQPETPPPGEHPANTKQRESDVPAAVPISMEYETEAVATTDG